MPLRLSLIALSILGFLIVILSNIQTVPVRLFMLQVQIPLFIVMVGFTLFGIIVAVLFITLGISQKRMRQKIEQLQTRPAQPKKQAAAAGSKRAPVKKQNSR